MDQVRKAIQDKKDGVAKNISPSGGKASGKSRTGQEGEVRTWKNGDFRKQGGKWIPVSEGKKGKTPPPSAKVSPKNKDTNKPTEAKRDGPTNHHVAKLSVLKDLIKTKKNAAALNIINELDDEAKNLIPHDILAKLYKWEAIHGGSAEKAAGTKAKKEEAKAKGSELAKEKRAEKKEEAVGAKISKERFYRKVNQDNGTELKVGSIKEFEDDGIRAQLTRADIKAILKDEGDQAKEKEQAKAGKAKAKEESKKKERKFDPAKVLKPSDVKEGAEMQYSKNLEKAPNMGKRFGQDVEAHGFYISQKEAEWSPPNYEHGTVNLGNPMVIDITDNLVGYKTDLSKKYKGLKGKKLSSALMKDGFDSIVTVDGKYISEVIIFDTKNPKTKPEPFKN